MPNVQPREFLNWKVQECELVVHDKTGLRFFVFDNLATEQTEVAIVTEFADDAVIAAEAEKAGHTPEAYTDFLADQAQEIALEHLQNMVGRH